MEILKKNREIILAVLFAFHYNMCNTCSKSTIFEIVMDQFECQNTFNCKNKLKQEVNGQTADLMITRNCFKYFVKNHKIKRSYLKTR